MTYQLLKCPFCGGNAEEAVSNQWYIIQCEKCGCMTDGFKDLEDAVDAWNERVSDAK